LRILIVDDYETVRGGVRSLLSSRRDWVVCGEAGDGLEAVEKAKSLRPDVVLMDISMPRMNGVEATRIIRREVPESKVIIVSQNDPAVVSRQAAEIGAGGYVNKADLARDLLPAVECVVADRSGEKTESVRATTDTQIDVSERALARRAGDLLAAIVDSSDDAIISKTLDGVITSWNKSAERLFGWPAQMAIGKHITLIVPEDRRAEEDDVLARVRRGERIDHFETVRMARNGR